MLEPVFYDIGRICKEKNVPNTPDSPKYTPKFIDFNIDIPPLGMLKVPFDCPKEVAEELMELNRQETGKIGDLKYQIINFGKYFDLANVEDADLYVVADGRRLIKRRELIEIIPKLREKISPNSGIYFPGALPWEIPLLVYLGVDYFDSTSAKYYASLGCKFTKNRMISTKKSFKELCEYNESVLEDILEEVKYCIKEGSLRNLVEETTVSDPYLRANYRRYTPDIRNIPLSKGKKIMVTIDETRIPEVKKYIERAKNYDPFTNVVVLLPCSSKKPYSYSKSHQLFINAINSAGFPVEELILTSPYGVVPRALEGVVDYDIPVTGEWSTEEIEFINKYLRNYIERAKNKFGDVKIIAHLPEHYMEILDLENLDYIKTAEDNPTSDESLRNLKDTLKEIKNEYLKDTDLGTKHQQRIHNYQELAKFQFGKNFIPDDVVVKGRHRKFFIKKDGKQIQICSLNEENGLFVLTADAGELLGKVNWVEVNFEVKKGGSLFAPGFKDCDENISVNDEVVIVKDDKVIGVGRALMSGAEMKKAKHGALVNIRHIK